MQDGHPVRLNLGCGYRKYEGFVNVDSAPECRPDVLWDLENTPWPWRDNSVEEIKLEHVLEHVGETSKKYLDIWKEMYRVCKPGAYIYIMVPHWNHDNFYHDPTHVRAITPDGIRMLDQAANLRDIQAGERSTKLGLFAGIDVELEECEYFYTQAVADAVESGALPRGQLDYVRDHQNNISNEIRMRARVIKPARSA